MNLPSIGIGGTGFPTATIYESFKNGMKWTGRQISKGFYKLADLMKSAWKSAYPYLKDFAVMTGRFLRTAPGIGILLGVSCVALGCAAYKNWNHTNKWIPIALTVSSVVLGLGTVAFFACSFMTGLGPLI